MLQSVIPAGPHRLRLGRRQRPFPAATLARADTLPSPLLHGWRRADTGADRGAILHPQFAGARSISWPTVSRPTPHADRLCARPNCRPIPHTLLDLWHCDAEGRYDNQGYRLRGHQFADAQGRFVFETIVPALYPGRTRHYHVKVQAPGGDVLTTQLLFPGEPGNERDRIFDAALLMDSNT